MDTDFDNRATHAIDKNTLLALLPHLQAPTGVGVSPKQGSPAWDWDGQDEGHQGDDEDAETPTPTPSEPVAPELAEAELFDHHGRSESAAGHYREARVLHEKAMELRRRTHGEADPHLPQSFCSLGVLAFHQGRLDEAEWHFRQAREIAEKRGLGRQPQMALILNNLGVIARSRGDDAAALAHYEAALVIKVERHGWEHPSVATTLINLGRLAERTGELRQALGHFAQARAIAELTEGAMGPALAASLLGLGRIHLRRGALVEAAFAFERALRIREAIACSPAQLASARFMMAMATAQRDPAEARALVVRAIRDYQVSESVRPENLEAMSAWLAVHDMRTMRQAS